MSTFFQEPKTLWPDIPLTGKLFFYQNRYPTTNLISPYLNPPKLQKKITVNLLNFYVAHYLTVLLLCINNTQLSVVSTTKHIELTLFQRFILSIQSSIFRPSESNNRTATIAIQRVCLLTSVQPDCWSQFRSTPTNGHRFTAPSVLWRWITMFVTYPYVIKIHKCKWCHCITHLGMNQVCSNEITRVSNYWWLTKLWFLD